MDIPRSLTIWFRIHFAIDYLIGIPLFFFPFQTLSFFGWTVIDPTAARLVAAALFAVGGASLMHATADRETMIALLDLKIIWSGAAILGLIASLLTGATASNWIFLLGFLFFAVIWIRYRNTLS